MAFEYADTRLRINALRKNTILPKELQVYIVILQLILWDLQLVRHASLIIFTATSAI